ncbi:hypothetical protein NQ317_006629 [Molorchus minor]|uniref:Uncharacterized protein n=1 Tax=Molorchus minor TaxID=1323400 RepID=A0ABQ9J0U6_9CUCU|nr:hypothetical protein NQ317_006629 [Molorchus minor]
MEEKETKRSSNIISVTTEATSTISKKINAIVSGSARSKNMWMQYSSDTYPMVEDIKSAVQRLACQLRDLSIDSEHATNYDLSVCFDDAAVQALLENAKTYKCGENLCHKFTEGLLNLEEFCELMYRVDLKRFLYEITGYLPEHILEQYKLQLPDDEDQSADNK